MSYTDYRLLDSLGEGGNGWVYLMRDNSNNEFAVKVSKINDEQVKKSKGDYTRLKLERFKTEATKVHELYKNGQQGIIPVETYELPCEKTGKYFFVMPKAIPLEEKVKDCNKIYELIGVTIHAHQLKNFHYPQVTKNVILSKKLARKGDIFYESFDSR
ncbi:hypothetical protein P7D08_25125 [Bacillus pacificus]|uniref:hypothetical protein n=1 Tax=Bacillus pacificus TaxID=2026187 RepID=UPI00240D49F0|nr:hypothetical protein [Bacillus pacificus]MDG1651468.1 hypothetical protein [Bacillus pacificus]